MGRQVHLLYTGPVEMLQDFKRFFCFFGSVIHPG